MRKIIGMSKVMRLVILVYLVFNILTIPVGYLSAGSNLTKSFIESGKTDESKKPSFGWGWRFEIKTPEGTLDIAGHPLSMNLKLLGVLAEYIYSLPFIIGCLLLYRIFGNYIRGNIFIAENIKYFKYCGYLFFVKELITDAVRDFITGNIGGIITNYNGIFIDIHPINFTNLMVGAVVIIISWVMLEGLKLSDEQRLTI